MILLKTFAFIDEYDLAACRSFAAVLQQVIAACGGDGLQLMVGQTLAESLSGCAAGAAERVVGVVHAVNTEHGLEASFVEGAVVGYEGKSLDKRLYVGPYIGKHPRSVSIFICESVYACIEAAVIIGFGAYQAVIPVCNLAVAYNDYAYAAHARRILIGCLEVNCRKVFHLFFIK